MPLDDLFDGVQAPPEASPPPPPRPRPETPPTLTEALGRLALDPAAPADLRTAAASLVGALPELSSLTGDALAAVEHAQTARVAEILRFYEPLLPLARDGKTDAPLADLRAAARECRALVQARGDGGPMAPLAQELQSWLPASLSSGHLAAVRFDGPVGPKPAARPEAAHAPPPPKRGARSRIGNLVLLLATLAVIGAARMLIVRPPPPPPLDHYRAVVPQVEEKSVEGDILVLSVAPLWMGKPRPDREEDLLKLEAALAGEGVNGLRIDVDGKTVARLDTEGLRWEPGADPAE